MNILHINTNTNMSKNHSNTIQKKKRMEKGNEYYKENKNERNLMKTDKEESW